jgi:primosomal protein N' (replication factor Y)
VSFGCASVMPGAAPALTALNLTADPAAARPLDRAEAGGRARGQSGERRASLLFLNRRGFAPLTLCRTCGHRFQCPNCTAWMVEHRLLHRLACHHCGHVMPPPKACPECGEATAWWRAAGGRAIADE